MLPALCCTRRSPAFPEHSEYIEVLPGELRIVCSAVVSVEPLRHAPIVMAYADVGPGHITIRLRPADPPRDYHYRIGDDDVLWFGNDPGAERPWTLIAREELPGWFHAFREKARERMDERWRDG